MVSWGHWSRLVLEDYEEPAPAYHHVGVAVRQGGLSEETHQNNSQ